MTIMNALCIDRGLDTSVVVGRVVDQVGRPVPDAEVQVDWTDYELPPQGQRSRGDFTEWVSGELVPLDARGAFRVCDVPGNYVVRIRARYGDEEAVDTVRVRYDELVDRTLTLNRGGGAR
jgi:hypothetical protein